MSAPVGATWAKPVLEGILRMQITTILSSRCPAWYAVQTGYRYEHRVAGDLMAKGFETYLPVLPEVHRWKDRQKRVDVPAFGGYMFVRYETSLENRVRVLETSGVLRLLGGNNTPVPIPDLEIEALQRTINSGIPCSRCEALQPGMTVRVARGPLVGIQGRLLRIKNSVRLIITISAVSQAISAELGIEDVEAVSDFQTLEHFPQRCRPEPQGFTQLPF
jgi:transcription termination/antitermination protein NusG